MRQKVTNGYLDVEKEQIIDSVSVCRGLKLNG
jgi:hypothetical protein